MKKPQFQALGGRNLVACCAFVFAAGCTGTIGSLSPSGGGSSAGGGTTAAGSAGTGAPGAGGTGTGGTGVTGTGGATGAGGTGQVVTNPPPFQPAAGMLRRLTRTQFRNAVRDVFGVEVNIANLDADTWNAGFATIGASDVVTSERGVEQYNTAIENAVNALFADANRRAQFIGCTPTGQASDPCVRGLHSEARATRLAPAARRARSSTDSSRSPTRPRPIWATLSRGPAGRRWRCSRRRAFSIAPSSGRRPAGRCASPATRWRRGWRF